MRKYHPDRDRPGRNFSTCDSCGCHWGNGSEPETECEECRDVVRLRTIALRLLSAPLTDLYGPRFSVCSRTLAERLLSLSAGPNAWPAIPDDAGLTDHQKTEITKSLSKPVGLLLGTPGTGKTFSAAAIIRAAIEQVGTDMIAVCAPTGKAAVRITAALVANKITSLTATTIHSLLKFSQAGWGYGAHNPIPQKYIFVDESSMADVQLACRLVESCAVGAHILWIRWTAH